MEHSSFWRNIIYIMLVSSILNISLASFGQMTHFENTYKMYKYLVNVKLFVPDKAKLAHDKNTVTHRVGYVHI